MKSRLFFLLMLFANAGILHAQVFQFHYGNANEQDAYPMTKPASGGFLIGGSSRGNNAGGKDALLLRTDDNGSLQWSRTYGGSGDETAFGVNALSNGGYAACGESFSASAAGDAFLFRTDSAGNLLWWKNYGSPYYDIAYSFLQLSDGGFVLAGLTETNPGDYDAFLIRTDSNGDTLWTKIFGGPGIDHAVQVIQTNDGGFFFCGKILSYGAGYCDCWLVKTDANGNLQWTNFIGGAGWDEAMSVVERPDGYALCGGTNSGGQGNYDFLLFKTDLSGNLQWAKAYGGSNVEASYSIVDVPGRGYAFCGYTETFGPGHSRGTDSANVWLIHTDYAGDTIWARAFGGSLKEECFSVQITNDSGFALTGYTTSFGDSTQAYLFTTDSTGAAGCNEKISHPDITVLNFAQAQNSILKSPGLSVNNFPAQANNGSASGTQLCGGPLTVREEPSAALFAYPNPFGETIHIRLNKTVQDKILLTDISGRIVKEEIVGGKNEIHEWQTGDIPPGLYLVQYTDENGKHALLLVKK